MYIYNLKIIVMKFLMEIENFLSFLALILHHTTKWIFKMSNNVRYSLF